MSLGQGKGKLRIRRAGGKRSLVLRGHGTASSAGPLAQVFQHISVHSTGKQSPLTTHNKQLSSSKSFLGVFSIPGLLGSLS